MTKPSIKTKVGDHELYAPFNMAIATLMRLDKILQNIRDLAESPFSAEIRQEMHLYYVKQFYLNAVPLLPDKLPEKFKFLLDLNMVEKEKIENSGFTTKKTGQKKLFYNPELELKLNKALQDIQIMLQQNERLFMPSKADPKFSWGNY